MKLTHLGRSGLAVLLFLGTSCTGDGTSPTVAPDGAVGYSIPNPSSASVISPALALQLQREQTRIRLVAGTSAIRYDSLKSQWNLFLRNNPKLKAGNITFPTCAPLPYAGQAQIIGPAGGTILFGPHRLTIPANALPQPTVITAEAPPSNFVQVELSPHGLQFGTSAELELSYQHCLLPKEFTYRLAYIDDSNNLIQFLLSIDKKIKGSVVGSIAHFSKYAVAY
ncbi:MAG: hypothetical protein ABI679_10635 [Gemmatimonadota bacterium]